MLHKVWIISKKRIRNDWRSGACTTSANRFHPLSVYSALEQPANPMPSRTNTQHAKNRKSHISQCIAPNCSWQMIIIIRDLFCPLIQWNRFIHQGTLCCHSWAAIKELDRICSLPYVWQLVVTFKIQRSCIKMLSIMWIRFIDVCVTELSSVEAILIKGSAGEVVIHWKSTVSYSLRGEQTVHYCTIVLWILIPLCKVCISQWFTN